MIGPNLTTWLVSALMFAVVGGGALAFVVSARLGLRDGGRR